MSICKTIYNFFRFQTNLGSRPYPVREIPPLSIEGQKDWDRIEAEIKALGNTIFNSGKDTSK